jgi:hypothetical protein
MNLVKPIYILGDVHGQFARLRENIDKYDLRDCYIICVGDLGIGFQHPAKGELSGCRTLNTFFLGRNIHFMSIRGNHDDPQYFNGPNRIELSNLRLLPDYHAETFNGERFLFVGGAVSIDRLYRVEGRSYWPNEVFVYDESKVTPCDVLITHSAPPWIGPFDKEGLSSWCEKDKTLWDLCYRERVDHDKLIQACGAKRHYCGHFHAYHWVDFRDCYSTILDIDQFKEHR